MFIKIQNIKTNRYLYNTQKIKIKMYRKNGKITLIFFCVV